MLQMCELMIGQQWGTRLEFEAVAMLTHAKAFIQELIGCDPGYNPNSFMQCIRVG